MVTKSHTRKKRKILKDCRVTSSVFPTIEIFTQKIRKAGRDLRRKGSGIQRKSYVNCQHGYDS